MSCLEIQKLGYFEFGNHMYDLVGQQRIPLNISVEITMRCNLRCKHCYIPPDVRTGAKEGELTLLELEQIFSEFSDAGALWLLITGGESLLRPDFLDIYNAAKRKGFIITIFTNGTLLNENIVQHFAEYRPFMIEISLYGATQETYERVTGIPGSFKRCRQGIDLLLKNGIPVRLKSALMTLNVHELVQMQQLSTRLGLKFRYDPVITSRIDGDHTPLKYQLPIETISEIESKDKARSKEWHTLYNAEVDLSDKAENMFICGAGRTGFHMDSYGKLSLCMTARHPQYDLRRGNFNQAWNVFFPKIIERQYTKSILCQECSLRSLCANCPAYAYIEVGDMEGVVPFLCELTHQREKIYNFSQSSLMQEL